MKEEKSAVALSVTWAVGSVTSEQLVTAGVGTYHSPKDSQ